MQETEQRGGGGEKREEGDRKGEGEEERKREGRRDEGERTVRRKKEKKARELKERNSKLLCVCIKNNKERKKKCEQETNFVNCALYTIGMHV